MWLVAIGQRTSPGCVPGFTSTSCPALLGFREGPTPADCDSQAPALAGFSQWEKRRRRKPGRFPRSFSLPQVAVPAVMRSPSQLLSSPDRPSVHDPEPWLRQHHSPSLRASGLEVAMASWSCSSLGCLASWLFYHLGNQLPGLNSLCLDICSFKAFPQDIY